MKPKIIILILSLIIILLSAWLGYTIENNMKLQAELDTENENNIGLKIDNGTKAISLDDKDKRIKELEEELAVKELTLEYAKDELDNLVSYTLFLQNLLDENKVMYPYYIPIGEDE